MIQRTLAGALAAISLFFAGAATAATLGLYFDPQTFPTETETSGPVDAWLVLRDVSPDYLISGWECSIETVADGSDPVMIWELLGSGPYNFASPPQFAIGMQTPFIPAEAITLAQVTIYPAGTEQFSAFHVQPYLIPSVNDADGYPVWRPVIARGVDGDLLEIVAPASGASWRPEARINPGGPVLPPAVTITGDSHFGAVAPGDELVRTLMLNQPGPATVFGRVAITGDSYALRIDDGPWTDDGRWVDLPPGPDVALEVRFAPLYAGPAYGELILDDGGPLALAPLTGGGGEAPVLVLEPDHLEFGSVPPAGTSQRSVVLRNVGTTTLTVEPGALSPNFELLGAPGPIVLEPEAEHTVIVAFLPVGPGLHLLDLDLGADLPPLLGYGHASGQAGCETVVNDPEAGDFGTVVIGLPAERDIVFTNTGTWDLAGDIQIEGAVDAFFVVAGGGPVVLPGGASHTVTVRCDPAVAGAWQAVLSSPTGCSTVALTCDAEEPLSACALDPEVLDFGPVATGYEVSLMFTLTNVGNVDLGGQATIADDTIFRVAMGGEPFELPPGETHYLLITFAPVDLGEVTGFVDLGTASCGPVPLIGVGRELAAVCEVDDDVADFGEVYVGRTEHVTVDVHNPGELPLVIDPVVLGAEFSLASESGPITVAAGESSSVVVEFRCPAEGTFTGDLDLGEPGCPPVILLAEGIFLDGPGPCTIRPNSTYYEDVPIGYWSDRDISVTNNLAVPVALNATTSNPVFVVVAGDDLVLAPHTAAWLTVRFSPQSVMYYDEQLLVAECSSALRGNGVLSGCVVAPQDIEFPPVAYGIELQTTVVVTNLTGDDLFLTPLCDEPAFTATPASLAVPPQQSAEISVAFLAEAPGSYSGILDLGSEFCSEVSLTATALDSFLACEVVPSNWSLGLVYVNVQHQQTVTVTNSGSVPLTISPSIAPGGSPFTEDTATLTLLPGAQASIPVRFLASEPGSYAATLTLGPDCCPDVPLSAEAVLLPPGECLVSPPFINLGEIPTGLFITRYGQIANVGPGPIMLDLDDIPGRVVFVEGGGSDYLPSGSVHTFVGRFYAPQEGDFSYDVVFSEDGCALPVSGYGTPPAFPCEIEPYVIDFGELLVGQTSFERFSIRNVSTTSLQLDIAEQVGPFHVSGAGPRLVGPLHILRPGATFAPDEPGEFFLPLDLGPDSCGPALLRGTATASPDGVVALARRLDFGVLDAGELGHLDLDIANHGDLPVSIAPTVVGDGFGLVGESIPRTASPGEILTFTVTCLPGEPGALRGRLDLGLDGHPDVQLVAEGRDPTAPAPTVTVVFPDGPGGPGQLRLAGLAPGTELIAWRGTLSCEGGRLSDWRPAGDAASLETSAGVPLVILPDQPLRADLDGGLTLAAFTIDVDEPGEVVLRIHGGAGRDWLVYTMADEVDRNEVAVAAASDHVVARFTVEAPDEIPTATRLRPIYPNPFNPGTNIPFELARSSRVRLRVFDVTGRLVATVLDESRAAGTHLERWEGRDDQGRLVASGTYYLRLEADGLTQLEKMTLLK